MFDMADINKSRGRKPVSEEMKKDMVSKIEPYLKSGLSIRASLSEAGISRATFYRIMSEDEKFRDQITQFRNYVSILVNNTIVGELMRIAEKQSGNSEKGIKPKLLSSQEIKFIWKFALKSNLTQEEFGRTKNDDTFDPEEEIQKVKNIIDQSASDEILHN